MLSGIATAILDNILNMIFDNIDNKSVDDEHIYKKHVTIDSKS